LDVDPTGVAERPRTGSAGRLGETAGVPDIVCTLTVSTQPLEHPGQGSFAELPRSPRRHPELPLPPNHQPRALQGTLDLLQAADVPDGVLSQGPP
jgi:hypothetical protein